MNNMTTPPSNKKVLNELLVETFNDILQIEQKALKDGVLNDLSITEVHTLEAIGMYGSRTMSEVAQDLNITVGTLTSAINKLVKKEYVERQRGEEDRRAVMIALTRKGKLAYRIHEKFHQDMIEKTINGLTKEEEKVLVKSLEKLNRFFKVEYKLENKGSERK
jgi:DNA-binding MarR family transcriptional regulator